MGTTDFSARPKSAVPRDLPLEGLSTADLALLGEGVSIMERKMDDKLMGVIRHVLTAVGAMMVYAGYTDDATWVTMSGAIMTFVPFVWSWMSK